MNSEFQIKFLRAFGWYSAPNQGSAGGELVYDDKRDFHSDLSSLSAVEITNEIVLEALDSLPREWQRAVFTELLRNGLPNHVSDGLTNEIMKTVIRYKESLQ